MDFRVRTSKEVVQFIVAMLCKIIYDYEILTMLPETYLGGMSHGEQFVAAKMLIGYPIYIIMFFWTFRGIKENCYVEKLLITVLFYLYYLPINSSFYLNDFSVVFFLTTTLFWQLLIVAFSYRLKILEQTEIFGSNLEFPRVSNQSLYAMCLFICACCLIYGYKYNRLDFSVVFGDLYELRAAYAGSSSILESLIFNFGGSLILSITMLYSLINKKIVLLLLSIISQIAMFSIAGQKSQFFIIVLVLLIAFAKKKIDIRAMDQYIPYGMLFFLLVAIFETITINKQIFFYLFVRRVMYIPAWINGLYYDFFTKNALLCWTQDAFLVERLGISRYNVSVLQLINETYFSGLMPSPNTGLFGEAFMHWGYLGVIFYPFFIALMLRWIFKYLKMYSIDIQCLVVLQMSLSLTNVALTSGIFCVTYFMFIPFTYILLKISRKNNTISELL